MRSVCRVRRNEHRLQRKSFTRNKSESVRAWSANRTERPSRLTAKAIGKKLHLNNGGKLKLIDASHIGEDGELGGAAHVYSRVSPSHKLAIVRSLKKTAP